MAVGMRFRGLLSARVLPALVLVLGVSLWAGVVAAASLPAEQRRVSTAPAGRGVVMVSAGTQFSCAVQAGGSLYCFGVGLSGRLGTDSTNNIGTSALDPVSDGLVALPTGTRAVTVSAGEEHTCAMLSSGQLLCFGQGLLGRLGSDATTNIGDSTRAPAVTGIVKLPAGVATRDFSAGASHTCAISTTGVLYCFGSNWQGQLGTSEHTSMGAAATAGQATANSIVPLPNASGVNRALTVACGRFHTCVILNTGALWCFGSGSLSKLGTGNTLNIGGTTGLSAQSHGIVDLGLVSNGVLKEATAVSAGVSHTCVVLDTHELLCFGNGGSGRLGQGNTDNVGGGGGQIAAKDAIVPLPCPPGMGSACAMAVSCGADHTCVILTTGQLVCFGSSVQGQLGLGSRMSFGDSAPLDLSAGIVPMPAGVHAVQVSAGLDHTCATLSIGTAICFGVPGALGTNDLRAYGIGATLPAIEGVVQLPTSDSAVAAAVGDDHTCTLTAAGKAACWGANAVGQTGYGSDTTIGDDELPWTNGSHVALPACTGAGPVTVVASGPSHTCVIVDNEDVSCFGEGGSGKTGYSIVNENVGATGTPASKGFLAQRSDGRPCGTGSGSRAHLHHVRSQQWA